MNLTTSKYYIFLLIVFFPFISFGTNDMDTQPWILIFALIFYKDFISSKKFVKTFLFIIFTILVIQIFTLFISLNTNLFYLFRGLSGYLIFLIIYHYQIKNYKKYYNNYENIIFKINYIYIFVALLQTLISPFITKFLVNARTSEARGVSSLTPEPTMFGIFLIFFCLLYTLIINDGNKKKITYLFVINLLAILLIAKSATASIYVLVGLFLWYLINIKSIKLFINIIILLPILYLAYFSFISSYLEQTRLSYIFNLLFNGDFFILLTNDKSIQDRILANIYPFKASYNNFFLPGGFNLELTLKSIDIKLFDTYFYNFHTGSRIMSLWGSLIAELGILFIIIFLL